MRKFMYGSRNGREDPVSIPLQRYIYNRKYWAAELPAQKELKKGIFFFNSELLQYKNNAK